MKREQEEALLDLLREICGRIDKLEERVNPTLKTNSLPSPSSVTLNFTQSGTIEK